MEKIITVDGLVASGKTTLCRKLSRRMNWDWLSTGVFYRGLAYMVMDLNLKSEKEWIQCIESSFWKVQKSKKETCFFYKNLNVTPRLKEPQIDQKASDLAQISSIRKTFVRYQREQKEMNRGLLVEGRDCGTVIFPKAPLKIYLKAEDHIRAQRRAKERSLSSRVVIEAQKQRDRVDLENTLNPLKNPVWTIQTDKFSIEQIEDMIFQKARDIFNIPSEFC